MDNPVEKLAKDLNVHHANDVVWINKHENVLNLLTTMEIYIKMVRRYHLTTTETAEMGEDMKQRVLLCAPAGSDHRTLDNCLTEMECTFTLRPSNSTPGYICLLPKMHKRKCFHWYYL